MPANELLHITLVAADGSSELFIGSDPSLNTMTLTVTNNSGAAVNFVQSGTMFYLLFNGMLTNTEVQQLTVVAPGWTVNQQSDARNGTYFWFMPSSNIQLESGDSIAFTLQFPTLSGSADSGYFSFQYENVQADTSQNGSEQLYIQLVYPPRTEGSAVAVPPLQFEFIGSNVVHNDGNENKLSFRITNTGDTPLIPGGQSSWGHTPPQFTFQFLQSDGTTDGWLLTNDQATNTQIGIDQQYGNTLVIDNGTNTSPKIWTITQDDTLSNANGTILGTGTASSVSFAISELKSTVPACVTMAILHYSGIPGYEDGQLTAELQVKPRFAITSFQVSPSTLNISNTTSPITVSFRTTGAAKAVLYKDGAKYEEVDGTQASSHSLNVTIGGGTTFTLVATNDRGEQLTAVVPVYVDMVPLGTVMAWYGNINNKPPGWIACDGTNSTPDLRGRFVLGVSSTYYFGAHADVQPHSHGVTTNQATISTSSEDTHRHHLNISYSTGAISSKGSTNFYHGDGVEATDSTDAHSHSVTIPILSGIANLANAELPPYYALYYLIKVS